MVKIMPDQERCNKTNIKGRSIYGEITGRKYVLLLAIASAIILTVIVDIMTGPAALSMDQVISTILFPAASEQSVQVIVWTFRLPVALTAVVIGAALGIAGANMQTILNNPLASPYTLGISAAAGFGAALAIVLGVGVLPFADTLIVPANAFLFSFVSCLAIYGVTRFKKASTETIVLVNLELQNLRFGYNSKPVLSGVSFAAEPMITAIIGPNAAGKSTLLKCICGILKPRGSIRLDGKPLEAYKRDEVLKAISYLPQETATGAVLTVFEAVLLGRLNSLGWRVREEDMDLVADTLEKLGLEELAKRPVDELSGGQKQMVSIAQSIVRGPSVLLMDEPTNSLDLQRQLELFDVIRDITGENKMTTVVALHDLNLAARYAGKVVLMNRGGVEAQGTPADVITEEMIRAVYGVNARVTLDGDGIPQVIPVNSARKRGLKKNIN